MASMLGYCTPLSVTAGNRVRFRTSTTSPSYTITMMRFRNSTFDLAEVAVKQPVEDAGRFQATPADASADGCGWASMYSFIVPRAWRSGMYAAKCEDADGSVFYITFVVKPRRRRRARIAVLANTNTWNAYNPWGGVSRYCASVMSSDPIRLHVERPNPNAAPFPLSDVDWQSACGGIHVDTTFQTAHLARGEWWVLNWLADAGYAADVYADQDMHNGIAGLRKYRALLLTTHPEYWSLPMLQRLKDYLQHGGRLLYLGGNGVYEVVDYDVAPNIMTVLGPYASNPRHRLFRNANVGEPEAAVLGVAYIANIDPVGAPYRVTGEGLAHRFLRGVHLDETRLVGAHGWNNAASGWEVDTPTSDSPADLQTLALGQNTAPQIAHMTYYDHPGGGWVFSVGSINFGGSLVLDCALQTIVRNALDDALMPKRVRRPRRAPPGRRPKRPRTPRAHR